MILSSLTADVARVYVAIPCIPKIAKIRFSQTHLGLTTQTEIRLAGSLGIQVGTVDSQIIQAATADSLGIQAGPAGSLGIQTCTAGSLVTFHIQEAVVRRMVSSRLEKKVWHCKERKRKRGKEEERQKGRKT